MKDTRKIKQLQSQLNTLISDASVMKIDLSNKQREYNQKLQSITKLKETIDKLNSSNEVKISEHAIIRYLERVKGVDISQIEKEILTKEVLELIEILGGSGKYPVNDFQIVMKDYTVTTVI